MAPHEHPARSRLGLQCAGDGADCLLQAKLKKLGLEVGPDVFHTSAISTAMFLQSQVKKRAREKEREPEFAFFVC